jgi:hypothetical protein
MIVTRTLLSSLAVVGLGSVLVAQAPALYIKLGLWENTVVTSIGGMAPIDTSKMSPEQAAKVAEMAKGIAGDRTNTEKSCIKREDLTKEGFMMPNNPNMTCRRTLITNTSSVYAADVACTGQQEMKGQVRVESQSGGSAFTGTMKMTAAGRGQAMNVSIKMSGKYLGADCGSIK